MVDFIDFMKSMYYIIRGEKENAEGSCPFYSTRNKARRLRIPVPDEVIFNPYYDLPLAASF